MSEGHAHAFCPDAEGDGTSLVVSRDPSGLVTSYGAGSAAAHRAAGLVPLVEAPPEARRDVDTLAHLREAESLGVGRTDRSGHRRDQCSVVTSTVISSPCARASARSRCRSSPAATRFSTSGRI